MFFFILPIIPAVPSSRHHGSIFPVSGGWNWLGSERRMTLVLLVVKVLQLLWPQALCSASVLNFASFTIVLTTWQSWRHCDIMMTSLWH